MASDLAVLAACGAVGAAGSAPDAVARSADELLVLLRRGQLGGPAPQELLRPPLLLQAGTLEALDLGGEGERRESTVRVCDASGYFLHGVRDTSGATTINMLFARASRLALDLVF